MRRSARTAAGTPQRRDSPAAMTSLWLKPRERRRARPSGTGTSTASASCGQGRVNAAMRAAISAPSAVQPSYFSLCTIAPPTPSGTQHTDRQPITASGMSRHHRQTGSDLGGRRAEGWPQRAHSGRESVGSDAQQAVHTSPGAAPSRRSQRTQTRGSARSRRPLRSVFTRAQSHQVRDSLASI